jgi:hypothetical protein
VKIILIQDLGMMMRLRSRASTLLAARKNPHVWESWAAVSRLSQASEWRRSFARVYCWFQQSPGRCEICLIIVGNNIG